MARFIVTHTIPYTEELLVKYAREEAPKFPESGVTWVRTYCDFENNKHFCEWEAPNKDAIEQILKDYEIPFDGIYSVRVFDVVTATLED
jgi:hypothetical protein